MGSSLGVKLNSLGLGLLSLSLVYLQCLGVKDVVGYSPSANCKTQECAQYQVVHSQKEFEIRSYKSAIWLASAYFTTVSFTVGYRACYINAYKVYNGGYSIEGVELEPTQPVLTDIIPKTSYDSTYRTYLLVPKDYQNRVPTPYDTTNVTAVTLPLTKYAAVTRFDGYAIDTTIGAAVDALKKSLKGTPWSYAAASLNVTVADYQFQKYDQPNNRINEVIIWFN